MGTSLLVMVSVLSAVEILVVLASVSEHSLKVFLGYKIWADLIYGVGMMLYMGLSGTISGVIISTFAAFFMTCTLSLAAAIIGYRKRRTLLDGTKVWIEYPPTLTVKVVKEKSFALYNKAGDYVRELKVQLNESKSSLKAA